ncbi:hypothetical protein DdX_19715 [Ditylenchus destructor]|uniref:Uncharacterized protein n=1 Tax=Ditylenchus destructor TaxID=166010 RepID=A0AAD4QX11_9BILA|nr:hypothetical protein DdX_19715 [Ditylenchus destructor]
MGQNISLRSGKHHRAKSSRDQNREKLYMLCNQGDISDDTWLEALKFLTFPKWTQKRLVCRRINGIAHSNISRLPKMVLESVDMYYNADDPFSRGAGTLFNQELEKLLLDKDTVVAFDIVMPETQSKQWFVKRGFTPKAPMKDPVKDNGLMAAEKWIGARQGYEQRPRTNSVFR